MARDSIEKIEEEIMSAIDRLIDGKPTHHALQQRAVAGKLAINFSTVATEARRSRTLIAVEPARLPEVRNRIVSILTGSIQASEADLISGLRAELVETRRALERSLQAQAEYCLARDKAERNARRWRDAFRRKIDAQDPKSNVVEFRR